MQSPQGSGREAFRLSHLKAGLGSVIPLVYQPLPNVGACSRVQPTRALRSTRALPNVVTGLNSLNVEYALGDILP